MFLNEIDLTGTIGQASATVCVGEIPPAFTNVASATGIGVHKLSVASKNLWY